MSTQMSGYQGAKRSHGGTTASIRNAERRSFGCSPFGQADYREPGVLQPPCVAKPRGGVCA